MSRKQKAKVFMVFDSAGDYIHTRLVTATTIQRGLWWGATDTKEWGVSVEHVTASYFNPLSNLTPEHQTEDHDIEHGYTAVLVAKIDLN